MVPELFVTARMDQFTEKLNFAVVAAAEVRPAGNVLF